MYQNTKQLTNILSKAVYEQSPQILKKAQLPYILAYKPSFKLNKNVAKLRGRLICA